MLKPELSGVFLPRPISAALWEAPSGGLRGQRAGTGRLGFFIALRGRGTAELARLKRGGGITLWGPLGNSWKDFPPLNGGNQAAAQGVPGQGLKPLALIGGGIGAAPLLALAAELPPLSFDFLAGFRYPVSGTDEKTVFGLKEIKARTLIIAAEKGGGKTVRRGRIPDFLEAAEYSAVFACGPEAMLAAAAAACKAAAVPCYVSLERRMACGVGACLGCTVETRRGSRRCCADGPIFPAEEIYFDS
jgi:NAD(P)H-flavin reductase